MAGVAGDEAPPAELRLVDLIHHQHHPPRGLLSWRVDGVALEAFALRRMTVDAVQVRRGGEEPHRVHELLDGIPFEDLDVLEHVLGHRRPLLPLPVTETATSRQAEAARNSLFISDRRRRPERRVADRLHVVDHFRRHAHLLFRFLIRIQR
jgi:hypothetical protein